MHRKLPKQRRHKAKDKENHVENKRQLFCTLFHNQGHIVEKCRTLYLEIHPQQLKKVEKENYKNGKEYSIIDVGYDDSHDDDVKLKEVPLKWFGKR